MTSVKPFRGLRYVPTRVDLGAVVRPAPDGDPRHVGRLLDDVVAADDGKGGTVRRARLRLGEWRRAGVLRRDEAPALYAVRRRDESGQEALALFCAMAVDAGQEGAAGPSPDAQRDARLDVLGVAVEPVVASFEEPRVRRTLENAVDREADASWRVGKVQLELWCLDEESTTARISTLLSQAPLTVEHNADALAAHAAWWRRTAPRVDDDAVRAGAFALAFLHPAEDAWPEIPVGAAFYPVTGLLE